MSGPRRILVVGAGAREHALAWRLSRDADAERVLVAPGNPGMRDVADVRPDVVAADADAVERLVRSERIDLVVVGPEAPLVAGVADRLRARDIPVFGPDAAPAAIEGSKAFCREIAREGGVAMPEGAVFDRVAPALRFIAEIGAPVVVKADGLAAGKGVTVCATVEEAAAAVHAALVEGVFGAAGSRVVVERALDGREVSLIAVCDGTDAVALPAARDHKRIGDGDVGPNTGGMGAYSPVAELDDGRREELVHVIHRPVLAALARRGTPFRGALYAGLMLTADGPRLLEFNARLGDPEAQAILPRVAGDLGSLLFAAATGRVPATATREQGRANPLSTTSSAVPSSTAIAPAVTSAPEAAVAVVLAAPGYPGTPEVGSVIAGIDAARVAGALVFCAGVAEGPNGDLVTAGGRVLTVVGSGRDVADAADRAYAAADRITFRGRQLRRDIGRSADRTAVLVGSASP